MTMDERELAARVGEAMFAVDRATKDLLGIELVTCEPGRAVMRMAVRESMLNGHDICHGGLIFTLADSTFAYACNSFNHRAVAAGVDINFIAPAHLGDTLTATGGARHQGGRTGIYDIEVTNQDGKTIALFRGRSTRIKGHFFDESENP